MLPSSVPPSASPVSQRRWSVVQSLQAAERRFAPGSLQADTVDRAISLALSDSRDDSTPAFLHRNVLRDGRKLTARSRSKEIPFDPTETSSGLGECLPAGSLVDALNTPENLAVAGDFQTRLTAKVLSSCGDAGRICLDGLLQGASVRESAAESGLSTRQVRHTRARIRTAAAKLHAEAAQ